MVAYGSAREPVDFGACRAQMAAYALSAALPEPQRPFPMDRVRIGDNSSVTTPAAGPTWSSTTSEASCEVCGRKCC
jgi:hypothetical protein